MRGETRHPTYRSSVRGTRIHPSSEFQPAGVLSKVNAFVRQNQNLPPCAPFSKPTSTPPSPRHPNPTRLGAASAELSHRVQGGAAACPLASGIVSRRGASRHTPGVAADWRRGCVWAGGWGQTRQYLRSSSATLRRAWNLPEKIIAFSGGTGFSNPSPSSSEEIITSAAKFEEAV